MSSTSTEIVKTGGEKYDITGDMTMKGTTNRVTFTAELEGAGKNPWGIDVVAYAVQGKISREDFGLMWNQALETGGLLVGDDITITLNVQLNSAQDE